VLQPKIGIIDIDDSHFPVLQFLEIEPENIYQVPTTQVSVKSTSLTILLLRKPVSLCPEPELHCPALEHVKIKKQK
jgi:hypothetical protein